jgi:hypothetical protein
LIWGGRFSLLFAGHLFFVFFRLLRKSSWMVRPIQSVLLAPILDVLSIIKTAAIETVDTLSHEYWLCPGTGPLE